MKSIKTIRILSIIIIVLAGIHAALGLFWHTGAEVFYATNVYGQSVKMFGDGLYAHESYFKAPIFKGTDAVTLFLVIPVFLWVTVRLKNDSLKNRLLHLGLLSFLLYNAASVAFGVSYNSLFLLYISYFSVALITFILAISKLNTENITDRITRSFPHKGTAIFMFLAGMSVFVWLIEIINALSTGMPISTMGMHTTEPTFIFDIGIIAPTAFIGGWLVLKRNRLGYILVSTLLTLNALIGVVVITQSLFQYAYKVFVSVDEFIAFVSVFVIMSIVALVLNIKVLRSIDEETSTRET